MSFYRNYTSKEDVLLKHLQEIHKEWADNIQETNISEFIMTLFRLFESMKPTIELLYKADLSHLLLRFINELCGAKAEGMVFVTHDSLIPYYNEKCVISV